MHNPYFIGDPINVTGVDGDNYIPSAWKHVLWSILATTIPATLLALTGSPADFSIPDHMWNPLWAPPPGARNLLRAFLTVLIIGCLSTTLIELGRIIWNREVHSRLAKEYYPNNSVITVVNPSGPTLAVLGLCGLVFSFLLLLRHICLFVLLPTTMVLYEQRTTAGTIHSRILECANATMSFVEPCTRYERVLAETAPQAIFPGAFNDGQPSSTSMERDVLHEFRTIKTHVSAQVANVITQCAAVSNLLTTSTAYTNALRHTGRKSTAARTLVLMNSLLRDAQDAQRTAGLSATAIEDAKDRVDALIKTAENKRQKAIQINQQEETEKKKFEENMAAAEKRRRLLISEDLANIDDLIHVPAITLLKAGKYRDAYTTITNNAVIAKTVEGKRLQEELLKRYARFLTLEPFLRDNINTDPLKNGWGSGRYARDILGASETGIQILASQIGSHKDIHTVAWNQVGLQQLLQLAKHYIDRGRLDRRVRAETCFTVGCLCYEVGLTEDALRYLKSAEGVSPRLDEDVRQLRKLLTPFDQ